MAASGGQGTRVWPQTLKSLSPAQAWRQSEALPEIRAVGRPGGVMAQKRSDNKMQALSMGGLAGGAFMRGYQAPQNGRAPI